MSADWRSVEKLEPCGCIHRLNATAARAWSVSLCLVHEAERQKVLIELYQADPEAQWVVRLMNRRETA